jgi:hypothetical protein
MVSPGEVSSISIAKMVGRAPGVIATRSSRGNMSRTDSHDDAASLSTSPPVVD